MITTSPGAITAQRGDEGHGAPMAMKHLGVQPLAFGCPAPERGHVGLGPQDGIEPMRRIVKWIVSEKPGPDKLPLWGARAAEVKMLA